MGNIISGTYYKVNIRYDYLSDDDGKVKKITEKYVVDALNYTEAEARILKYIEPYVTGDSDVKSIQEASFKEIIFTNKFTDDKYYLCKVDFPIEDEEKGKIKHDYSDFLVQSNSLFNAVETMKKYLKTFTVDSNIVKIEETKFLDVVLTDTTNKK